MTPDDWTAPARLFRHHVPAPAAIPVIEELREGFEALGCWIEESVPRCPERTLALRALHEASKHAVFAIVSETPAP